MNVANNAAHIANLNPLRYRSYFYDAETGWYWLNTRYYNPVVGRFINADGQINLQEGVTGYNLFQYCGNNPINRIDSEGMFWEKLKEFGESCVKAAVVVGSVGFSTASIVSAVAFTGITGGAGVAAIPVAVAVATESLAVATTVVAGVGVASIAISNVGEGITYNIGQNGTQTQSKTVWRGRGEHERLDVENPSPGNRDGQIHYHDQNNKRYMYNFETKQFENATSRLKRLLVSDKSFVRGFQRALKYLGE